MSDPTADEDEDDPGLLVKASFALGIPLHDTSRKGDVISTCSLSAQ